ncbi:serine/threonine protein phosphatase 1 [Pullulanibacillus pueri]|nr:metallophosphoesterase family protein [Pullulanibacillus pueri]MBM7682355.1 serine/threonine protein phosphatase 1 [Pullulanibacillus pueri]
MDLFVVGDLHGCYYTFRRLLDLYWDPSKERLVQVGDLIDRGNYSPETVAFARELKATYSDQVIFLKGNHEFEIIEHVEAGPNAHWLRQCGQKTLKQYHALKRDLIEDIEWFKTLPLCWENDYLLISHAGISHDKTPFDEENPFGVLWNRSPLKTINKLQVIGHTPCDFPTYTQESHSWNIDTGAAYHGTLTGMKMDETGIITQIYQVKPSDKDIL